MTEFHHLEYTSLKQEIIEFERQEYDLVKYSLLSNAALISWVISKFDQGSYFYVVIAWLPLAISLFFFLYYRKLEESIRTIGLYLKELEIKLSPTGVGWETFSTKRVYGQWSTLSKAFTIQILCVLVFACYYTWATINNIPQLNTVSPKATSLVQ